jgi:hypothetical protein
VSRWIWDAFHRETPNQLLLLRRVVTADTALVSGTIRLAARGSFRVWVDDRFITHQDLQSSTPGADAVTIDLSEALSGGTSATLVVGVHLLGIGTHHQQHAVGGLLVDGDLLDAAGSRHTLVTDRRWETSVPTAWRQDAPQTVWSAGFTEWSDRTIDDAAASWSGAVEYPDVHDPDHYERRVSEHPVDLDRYRTETGSIPTEEWARRILAAPNRAAALVAAGPIRECRNGGDADSPLGPRYVLYRLPHQVVGFLTVIVDAAAPATLDVAFGETVDTSGWPTATRQGIAVVDTVVVPTGRTVHRFWNRRTFRDLAIVVRSLGGVAINARFAAVTADRPDPVFDTTSDRYARMHAISVATVAVGRQDLYEDCPLREGGHYVADARLQAAFDITTTGVAETSRRSIRQFAAAQDPDGMIPALTPSGTHHRIPDFALQWVCQLDEHVRLSGDDELLTELRDTIERTMAWADGRWSAAGFDADGPGWWPFIDWYPFTPEALQAALDAQYAAALRAASALATRLGDDLAASRHAARLRELLAARPNVVRHPHAAAILACALNADEARQLVDLAVFDDFRPATGYFMFFLCRALIVLGEPGAARRRLDDYWGAMMDAGAGTWWERWSANTTVEDQSLCHPWSAGPIVLLPMLALGIDPFERDEAAASFTPVLDDARMRTALHTPWGVRERSRA